MQSVYSTTSVVWADAVSVICKTPHYLFRTVFNLSTRESQRILRPTKKTIYKEKVKYSHNCYYDIKNCNFYKMTFGMNVDTRKFFKSYRENSLITSSETTLKFLLNSFARSMGLRIL